MIESDVSLSLRQQIADIEERCKFCADKLEANIRLLQCHLVGTPPLDDDRELLQSSGEPFALRKEETFLALASLKQVNRTYKYHASIPFPLRGGKVHTLC